ncbi:LuxR family transcriptional regulator [Actinomadura sp. WMMA1423]|uniref:helix-turn-helix transcriptional regulator n=1 Tax=Actinomadura sp. WMMA1423 TaxID=2591108 RepID=UPI001146BE8F|nr:LuxR family transcriptional regulator [Actinomadura sp. WMMA1423]
MEAHVSTIVGRDGELERLSAFVTAGTGQALVLRGEAGVGKSALLDRAASAAASHRYEVVRAAGVEAEAELPFAGLHQLVYPLLTHLSGLDDGYRAVFDAVFGPREGKAPSVMALGIAVLDLLSLAAADRPLMLVVDDGQWFDPGSADVCGFVGRRLSGGPVKMLVAVRSGAAPGPEATSRFDTAGLPELAVAALPDEAAGRLLDMRHPHLGPRARRLVLDHAQGNPLALLDLPPYLDGERAGELIGIPLPRRLQHVYGTRIERLDPAVREELLKGALDGVGAGTAANRAYGTRYRLRRADEAAASGLLEVDPVSGDLVFRHPLIRSAVVQFASPERRRAAHAELAALHRDDVERRAHHLAASAVDPDEETAAALEAAADSAIRRGRAMTAVTWLTRAAELSEDAAERSRRLGDAAFTAGHSALLDQAQRIVGSVPPPDGTESPSTAVTAGYVALHEDGDVRSSHHRVAAAIERLSRDARDPGEALDRLVILLLAISQYAGDGETWERTRELVRSLSDRVDPRVAIYHDAWSDVVRHGAGLRERVERAFCDPSVLEPWDVSRLAIAASQVDMLSPFRPYLRRAADREVETGAVANGMTVLQLLMLDQMAAGEWDDAERTGRRALDLTTSHGYALLAHQSRAHLGLLAAMRGDLDDAREAQAVVDAWARPRGVGFLTQIADAIGTAAALSEGDYEGAYLHAIGITAPGSFEDCAHQAPRTLLDLVEAAVQTGRLEQARLHAAAALEAGLPGVSPRLALITYGALAMTASGDEEADGMYARAEAHPGFPFELARIRLARGVRLRHARGPKDARPVLASAAETFERLGASGWAGRARTELRACGAPAQAPHPSLTWQEHRIAELAATGLTNKEIGQRTRLSPRTVSSHLYRVFPKLGITSRAALRDALARAHDA